MILRGKPGFVQLAFAIRGSIVPAIAPQVLGLAAFAALVVWGHRHVAAFPDIDATPFTVFGVALSLFLGFRNNAAYDRWWEGRKLTVWTSNQMIDWAVGDLAKTVAPASS